MRSTKEEQESFEEDDGSDSEISEDNFDSKDLQKNLNAALDIKEGETNPFERSISEEEYSLDHSSENSSISL